MIPGQLGNLASNDGDLMRMIADLDRRVTQLAAANPLATAGLSVQPNQLTVAGNLAVTGTLSLPAGIINNAALANPILPQTLHGDARDFALNTGANAEILRVTFNVPTGFTQVLVLAVLSMTAANSTGSVDSMYLKPSINGMSSGWSAQTSVAGGNAVGAVTRGASALLTGLVGGGTFYVAATASSGNAAWAATINAANSVNIDATAIFLR